MTKSEKTSRVSSYVTASILLVLTTLVFYPIVSSEIKVDKWGDFFNHARFIQHIGEEGVITVPNFFNPLLVFTISRLSGIQDIKAISVFTTTSFYLLLAFVLLYIFRKEDRPATSISGVGWSIFFILSMMLFAPVSIISFGKEGHYFGYIALAVYHNDNIALARPLSLLHFFLLARFLRDPAKMKPIVLYCFMPLLLVMTALAKPNYLLALFPATFLYCMYQVGKKQSIPWKKLFLTVFLPIVCVLGWQYAFTYLYPNPDLHPGGIVWAPFVAYGIWSDDLLPKFLLSILFPLGVVTLYWDELREDRGYLLAIALLIIGLIINYGFAESGSRAKDMNFAWTGQISLFIFIVFSTLRVISIENLLSNTKGKLNSRLITVSLLFGLHLVSGIVWYYCELTDPGVYW